MSKLPNGREVFIIEIDGLPEPKKRHAFQTRNVAHAALDKRTKYRSVYNEATIARYTPAPEELDFREEGTPTSMELKDAVRVLRMMYLKHGNGPWLDHVIGKIPCPECQVTEWGHKMDCSTGRREKQV